jgi:hypothetical protein
MVPMMNGERPVFYYLVWHGKRVKVEAHTDLEMSELAKRGVRFLGVGHKTENEARAVADYQNNLTDAQRRVLDELRIGRKPFSNPDELEAAEQLVSRGMVRRIDVHPARGLPPATLYEAIKRR